MPLAPPPPDTGDELALARRRLTELADAFPEREKLETALRNVAQLASRAEADPASVSSEELIQARAELSGLLERFTQHLEAGALPDPTLKKWMPDVQHALRGYLQFFAGYCGGTLEGVSLGGSVALHEMVGHLFLGGGALYERPAGWQPVYGEDVQLDSVDAFNAILDADPGDRGRAVLDFLIGADIHDDGAKGWAYPDAGAIGESKLVERLGMDGAEAWMSIAGSLPALALNSIAAAGGMKLRESHPALGYAMLGFAASEHVVAASYPITAAFMDASELEAASMEGHDFANFAVHMGEISGLAPETVAVATAAAYTGFLPAVAVAMYLHEKKHRTEIVPDGVALQHWLSKSKTDPAIDERFSAWLQEYPGREGLDQASARLATNTLAERARPGSVDPKELEASAEAFRSCKERFDKWILSKKLTPKELDRCKEEVLRDWQKFKSSDRLQQALGGLALSGQALSATAPLLELASDGAGVIGAVGGALSEAVPVLSGFHAVSVAYGTVKDLRAPNEVVPTSAKVLSVGQLVAAGGSIAAITVASGGLALPVVLASAVGGFGLALAKNHILKEQFKKHLEEQAAKPLEYRREAGGPAS